jgi:hypothetical protein
VWVLVAPFLLVTEDNKPAERMFSMCGDIAYQRYGSSSAYRKSNPAILTVQSAQDWRADNASSCLGRT